MQRRNLLAAGLVLGSIAMFAVSAAGAKEFRRGALVIQSPWSRATAPGMTMGVGYFTIINTGRKTDVLISASSPRAQRVEIHRTIDEGGVARMRPAKTLVLPPGGSIKAAPGGLHLMLIDLKQPLVAGSTFPLTLMFRDSGAVTVQVSVRAIGVDGPSEHAGH